MKIPRINRFSLFGIYLLVAAWSLFQPKATVFLLDAYKEKRLRDAQALASERRFGRGF